MLEWYVSFRSSEEKIIRYLILMGFLVFSIILKKGYLRKVTESFNSSVNGLIFKQSELFISNQIVSDAQVQLCNFQFD